MCKMLDSFYTCILPSLKGKARNVHDAISDLPALYPLEFPKKEGKSKMSHMQRDTRYFTNHIPRFHNARDIAVFKLLAEDIKSRQKGVCQY